VLIPRAPRPEDAGIRLEPFKVMACADIDLDLTVRPGEELNRSHRNDMLL
jgi:hypothetical protein